MNIEQEIESLKERNRRVEIDKSWEVSWARKGFIALLTYAVALVWLKMIHEPGWYFKAFVPLAGYILSTWSLPPLKKLWIARNKNR